LQMAARFLTLISQDGDPSFVFQTFSDKKDVSAAPQIFSGSFEQHQHTLAELNQRGVGIFVTINQTDGKGRKTENIIGIRAAFVDLDGSPLEPLLQSSLQPHMVIESSPGRYHAYWLVEGLALDEFTPLQKMIAAKFSGDPQVCDLSRVMRLPGFYHHKGQPHLCKIIMESGEQPVSKEQLIEKLQLSQHTEGPNAIPESDNFILHRLKECGLLIKKAVHPPGCWIIRCPWSILHSSSESEAKYFEPDLTDHPLGGFHCFHKHCKERSLKDLKHFLGIPSGKHSEPLPLHRPLALPQPFPFDALGSILKPAALSLQRVIQAPDAICAQSILGTASLACQPFANVFIDGRKYPLSLFLITVAESGDRKSATDKFALKPLYEWQKMLCNTFRAEQAKYVIEQELWKAQKKEWLQQASGFFAADFTLPSPIAPIHLLILVEEPTYEGIVKYLDVGQPSVGLFSDEGGRFFGGHAMNRDNQIKTIAGLSSLWDGKEISRMRSGEGSVVLYGRRLALHLMIQEVILERLMSNRMAEYQGFLPRCLISYPLSTAGNRPYVEEDLNHNPDLVRYWRQINCIVATVELKTDFTQNVEDAVDQYRFDRHPKPKGQSTEPLLSFPNGALVHFAVSNREVRMTTKLEGAETRFLPFNQGNAGSAGNPPRMGGHLTAYLWENVWARDSWLEILGRYLVAEKNGKKQIERIIFPRFHQLDVTRKLVKAVLKDGSGGKYLIQHSAGSGKTNSIAWSAHFLADLHNEKNQKLFDTVLVVSDRNVIDAQLQKAIFDFERTTGVVATIKGESTSKSGELVKALSGDKKIVVCTIQTFPHALKAVRELAATQGKRFAVIADEAHSSQTGQAAVKLKAVLSPEELNELRDGGEVSTEDLLAIQMAARAKDVNITYVAFTATPKAKTLELFGCRLRPDLPAGPDNLPMPFHVYSMRQAIEEKFILDVLKNYTPYKLAFKLAHNGHEWSEKEVERNIAMKGIMRWVRLHPHNVAQKVRVVVEHFHKNVEPLLNGHAKAMVVVGSRLEAVRWKLAIDDYIKRQDYKISTLVAFSGEVNDLESGPDTFTETNKTLNPKLFGRDIRDAFSTDEYRIMLVANKFQTGFDQPLLCGMYVDKRLGGIQAVQTLSRLNRAYSGPYGVKDTTYILDFVNDLEEIREAFKAYYDAAELENVYERHNGCLHSSFHYE
jgi:hypothetical protein